MNSGLRRRLLIAYFLGTALLLAGAGLATLGMSNVIAMYEKDVGNLQEARADTFLLLASFRMQLVEWQNVLMRGQEQGLRDKHWQAFEQQEKLVREKASRLTARLPAGEARQAVKNFAEMHRQMGVAFRQGMNAFKAGAFDPRFGDKVVVGAERRPTEALDQVTEAIAKAAEDTGRRAVTSAHEARKLAVLLILAWGVAGALLYYAKIHYGVLVPLRDLLEQMGRLAKGKVDEPVTSYSGGEVRQLAVGADALRQRIARLLDEARHASDALAESSLELKSAAETVIKNIETGSRSLASLTATTDQVILSMRRIGEQTRTIQSTAMVAVAKVRAGQNSVSDLTQGLEQVNRFLAEISKAMSGFSVGMRGINGMTRKIHEIAEQTRLLALNAALESGQAGNRSPAVASVAEQVRALAQHTAHAAQDITTLTYRLNAYACQVEKVLQRGRARLIASLAESRAADQVLLQAVEAGTLVSEGVAMIADAIRRQEGGIRHVSSVTADFASDPQWDAVSVVRIKKAIDQLRRCAVSHHRRAAVGTNQR